MKSDVDKEYEGRGITADEDRIIVLGSEILGLLDEYPDGELSAQVLAFLDARLTDAGERALFNLRPKADCNGKPLPLH